MAARDTGDSCASCFYARYSAEINQLRCLVTRPPLATGPVQPAMWPTVKDTDWCGEGADHETGQSFSAGVTDLPAGPAGPAGPQGDPGPPGADGADGSTIYTSDNVAPDPGTGVDGELWFVFLSGTSMSIHRKEAGTWTLKVTLS